MENACDGWAGCPDHEEPWLRRATLCPELVELKNWPSLKPDQFLRKHLWQKNFFDHIIGNDTDLHENLDYIAMNPVKAGYVTRPQFYPYSGFTEGRLSSRVFCWATRGGHGVPPLQ